ncbi:F0F1 ATP synthase subunit B [Alistipes sp.]|uniref:F0F1 ATP synthase subunit B n=1 Tax=Alistipes sp. TaxID=1872444 RepID=UPI003AB74FFA
MGLLQPESGLLFWMTLAFGTVFFLVAKFGFPVIVKAIDDRKNYIDSSLAAARKARQQLSEVEAEKRMMLVEAEAQRTELLRAASAERDRMLAEARESAASERARLLSEARTEAETERQEILRSARQQVALLAVAVTEKMLRRELQDRTAQTVLAGQLLDEIEHSKYGTTCTPD